MRFEEFINCCFRDVKELIIAIERTQDNILKRLAREFIIAYVPSSDWYNILRVEFAGDSVPLDSLEKLIEIAKARGWQIYVDLFRDGAAIRLVKKYKVKEG